MQTTDENLIREIEEHSFNAGPALHTSDYDGWIIREAKGHTKRANSVNFLFKGTLPVEEKIKHCEDHYARLNQPCIFRVTPLAFPKTLDIELETRSYKKIDPTDVCIREIGPDVSSFQKTAVEIETELSSEWLNALARLTDLSINEKSILMEMSNLATLKRYFASIRIDGDIVACGLGVSSDQYIGLFEFATHPDHQRQRYANAIAGSLLRSGYEQGACRAYLQVVQSNESGQKFWKSLGFEETLYPYHYRIKT